MATAASTVVNAEMPSAKLDNASSHPYTCNTCQVAFRNSDLQRGHMRGDWHRYNLKRRVSSLSPITAEVFSEKVLAAQASSSAAATKAAYEKICMACQKTYFSENAYQNHVGSQKHRARITMLQAGRSGHSEIDDDSLQSPTIPSLPDQPSSDTDEDVKEVDEGVRGASLRAASAENIANSESASLTPEPSFRSSEQDKARLQRCLFCNYESPTPPLNAVHMERIHGMFIPERKYLVDFEGLIASLHEKINELHECLYCGKLKPTIFGLQTHMRDKGHCKIRFTTEDEQLEIGEFYDFTSTYSDVEDELSEDELPGKKNDGGVRLEEQKTSKSEADENGVVDGDGWETDSSASSLDSADLTAVPLDQHMHQYEKLDRHPHHSSLDPRPHHNRDGWHSHAHKHAHAAFYSDYELHLPSGRSVGHRSLHKYYRQNLHNHPSPSERQEQYAIEAAAQSDDEDDGHQVIRQNEGDRGRTVSTRANGGLGMVGVTDQKRREVQMTEKRARKVEERERRRFQWGNNKQNNFQKHFRDPLLQ